MAKDSHGTVEQVGKALEAVMAVDVASLERVVQEAHESTARQMEDPLERFAVSRQALRMFWHFRCNLEAVKSPGRPCAGEAGAESTCHPRQRCYNAPDNDL